MRHITHLIQMLTNFTQLRRFTAPRRRKDFGHTPSFAAASAITSAIPAVPRRLTTKLATGRSMGDGEKTGPAVPESFLTLNRFAAGFDDPGLAATHDQLAGGSTTGGTLVTRPLAAVRDFARSVAIGADSAGSIVAYSFMRAASGHDQLRAATIITSRR